MVIAIANLLNVVYIRRELISEMVRRELRDRHAGQALGTLWAYGHPLLLMLIYTGLFAYVFPARFGTGVNVQDFSTCVLAGIVPWLAFQDLLARAPSILVGHSNLVKQIVFPIEILPVKATIASILPYIVGVLFAVGYSGWHNNLSLLTLTLPWLALCQFAAMTGVAFLLSVGGIFFRDLREIVQVFCAINLFAQPILYNPFSTPKWLQAVFVVNPFSYLTWCWQDALYHGKLTHPWAWIIFPLGSFALLTAGWLIYQRSKHSFGDAL